MEYVKLQTNKVNPQRTYLVLGSVTDQSFGVGESDVARCGPVALVVGNDLDLSMLEHSHARVCCTKVDADCWSFRHCFLQHNRTLTVALHVVIYYSK